MLQIVEAVPGHELDDNREQGPPAQGAPVEEFQARELVVVTTASDSFSLVHNCLNVVSRFYEFLLGTVLTHKILLSW